MAPPYTYPVAGIVYFATHPQVITNETNKKKTKLRLNGLTTFLFYSCG